MLSSRFNARRNGSNSMKNPLKMHRKSIKIGPKSVLEALLGHPGAIFPPRAPRAQKTSKTAFADPPRIQVGSQNRCKIDPEAFQTQYFFVSFFRIAFEHLRGPILIGSGVRRWSKNRTKINVRSDLA